MGVWLGGTYDQISGDLFFGGLLGFGTLLGPERTPDGPLNVGGLVFFLAAPGLDRLMHPVCVLPCCWGWCGGCGGGCIGLGCGCVLSVA